MNRERIISEYMAELAGKRQRRELDCAICGTPFRGLPWSRFCSNRCRQRNKHAQARAQAPRRVTPP